MTDINADIDITGDMDVAKRPVCDRMDVEYKIYVKNLPSELNKDAIGDIFSQYGKITGMFHPYNTTWAFITYGSYREAECAIRELNNKKPLYLKVVLAKDNSCKQEKIYASRTRHLTASEDISNPVDTADAAESSIVTNTISKSSVLKLNQSLSTIQNYHIRQLKGTRYPLLEGYNVYENKDPYMNTSRLWSRDLIINVSNKKRRVSLGRGYTGYEVPEPHPQIEKYIKKVYEQRYGGLYEHFYQLDSKIKRCSICFVSTTKHCEKCDTYYCSKVCQIKDWPRHQIECERIPALVEEAIDGISLLEIKDKTDKHNENQAIETSINNAKLRRPHAPVQSENLNSTNDLVKRSKHENQGIETVINDVKLRRPYTPMSDSLNSMTTFTNDTTNQHGYMSSQYDNDTKNFQIKRTDQPVMNMSDKNITQLNQSQKFHQTNENTDPSKKNVEYPLTSKNTYQSNYVNKVSSNNGRFNSKGNMKNDKNPSDERNESQNSENCTKPAVYNDRENNINGRKTVSNSNTLSNDLVFQKDIYLSKTMFTDVEVVVPLDNDEYWIYKIEDIDARISLMVKLQDVAEKSCNVQLPILGNIYGVRYETIWHRAMVTSLNPVKVHFIDFGNDEILEKGSDIKDIQDMSKPPKFAKKIRLMQPVNDRYKNLQCGDKISIKMISLNADNTIMVEIQEQPEVSSVCIENAPSLNTIEKLVPQENKSLSIKCDSRIEPLNILNALNDVLTESALPELEFAGLIHICESVQSNIYNATLCPYIFTKKIEAILNNLQIECTRMESESVEYKPQAGDFVCGKTKDGWQRGYIVANPTSTDLRISLIDEAKIVSVDKILPCPAKFLDICSFGVTCEINQVTRQLEVEKTYKFTTIMKEQNKKQENFQIDIIINNDSEDSKVSEMITALIKPWKPLMKSQVPALSELKNGSKICLISYRNHYFMFGRSLDKKDVEYYHKIMQRVALATRTAPYLSGSEDIENLQMVIAPFVDGNHYRAIVTAVQDDKAKIIYIDFGNINEVSVKKLQILPDDLKREQSCALKIYLKDVPRNVPISKDVDIYLRYLVAEELPLTCTYNDTSLKDGIYLTMSTGENVNEKINRLLKPNWKQENYDDKTCYMLNDVQIANLGNVGDTVDALVLFIQEEEKKHLMLAPVDIDLVTHITEVMPSQIKEYCESTEYYIPRAQELCLALYEEAWYRAVCFVPETIKGRARIFFIDYGNVESVEHKNIRYMPKTFIEPAALANMCTIVNLDPINSEDSSAVQQILAKLKSMESIVKIKIVDCPESGDYKAELLDMLH